MSALNDAFLKAQHRFLIGSCAPIAFNVIWAILCYLLKDTPGFQAALMMCLGICLAYCVQWLVTYLGMRQEIPKQEISGTFWSPKVRQLLKPMLQGMLGVGATQINGLMDAFFALKAEIAGPTYLWFAIRIEQAPLALIGLAISSAGLPLLARAIERNDQKEAIDIYRFSFERMLGYMMPVCSAMMCLAFWGVRVALERGDFQAYDSSRTALCLWGYSLGLMGQGILFLVQNLCFSIKLYLLVTRSALYAVGFNMISNWFCVAIFGFGAPAIAFTTTLATFIQLMIIHQGLHKKGKGEFSKGFSLKIWSKYALVFTGAFLSVSTFISYFWNLSLIDTLQGASYPPSQNTWVHLGQLIIVGSVWALSYIPLSFFLRLPFPWNTSKKSPKRA
jgi:putative peptidoglycan lipid II flippase